MASTPPSALSYKRSRFSTLLPLSCLYTSSHAWLEDQGDGLWRVGLTKFATRMLGEMVDCGFDVQPDQAVNCGQVIGWVEGFKAISDVFCVVSGRFAHLNPALSRRIQVVSQEPYGAGWLYEARGVPDPHALDVRAYAGLLDNTIDRILEQQK